MKGRSVAVALLVFSCNAAAKTVWIDTDAAIGSPIRDVDDGFALVLAFHSPELRIAGVSTTYGNAPLEQTTRVAREMVTRFGGAGGLNVDRVYAGASSPRARGERTAATDALIRAATNAKLTYIALGPLTNLAAAVQAEPHLASRIERVVFVGGRSEDSQLRFGPWLRIHDANVRKDPDAAGVVLGSKIPITLVPPESTLSLTASELAQLRAASPSADFLFSNTRVWSWFWTVVARRADAPVFDAGAVLVTASPQLAVLARRNAVLASGELIVSSNVGRSVTWCSGFKREAKSLLLRRLRTRAK